MKIVLAVTSILWLICVVSAIASVALLILGPVDIYNVIGIVFNTTDLIVLTIFNILALKEIKHDT